MNLPSGSILLWSGAIVNIPAGFVLCDGNNGTPNLQNRFVPGAGDAYGVGDNGGSDLHTHNFTTAGHGHTIPAGADIGGGPNFLAETTQEVDIGTTDPGDTRPRYYALAYIMRT